ncbi:putative NADPH-quinone reductase [Pedobacter psychrotolerans]|uniref:Flavodoxin n=1 Tax=Pedobacter psychrotolerans TaxID=1843235 RepID=A0A4R2H3S1_9SPHI|nr:NAD(P)H-dependent oxidoreductase [Pedobacter psychrotolerans]TCO19961.1 putative NADPH-quinone reductase [Pedobacter psychrotolerans]GGE50100.1 flavodoxin [Pedobacter psychrotolerans]
MSLIILAHPAFDTSFANKTIIDELKKSNNDIEIRNIHELYPDYKIDSKAEQEALLRHKTIIFQYPFYWYNMPAILKQWFDVVFEYQFAYGSKGDKLKGKNFIPSFTVGAPENGYRTLAEHHFRINEFCKNIEQTAYYAQMNYIEPIYFHGTSLAAGFTKEEVTRKAIEHAKKLIALLNDLP